MTPMTSIGVLAWTGSRFDKMRMASRGCDLNGVVVSAIATVATPPAGKTLRLMSGSISVSAPCSVVFEDNAAGVVVYRTPKLTADTPFNFDLGAGALLALPGNVLKGTASAPAALTGTLRVTDEE